MPEQQTLRWLPAVTAAAVAAIVAPSLWSRDIGVFLISFFFGAPVLIVAFLGFLVWAYIEKSRRRLSILLSVVAMLILPPIIFVALPPIRDHVEFEAWYLSHQSLVARFTGKNAIIATWDRWGFAGGESDSFLVSVPADNLSAIPAALAWANRYVAACSTNESYCDVVGVARMRRGIYLVTAYDSPFQ